MEQINIFRPYIKDLCKQLEHLHKQNQSDIPLTIFRGHGNMTMDQFEKLKENIGALISFNGFLSATMDYNVAVIFAGSQLTEDKSVIYEIRANYNLKNVVFADITQLSAMEDEKEFLFSLCSIFRIDGITNDDENQLSKIIMSAVDEDAINIAEQIKIEIIQGEENHFFCCINQYCHKQYIIKAFAIIFLIMVMALGIIVGINIKLKDHTLKLNNCVGSNCTTFSATITTVITTAPTDIESSAVTNLIKTASTTLDYGTTNTTVSTRIDCVPVGWNYKGDLIKNESSTTAFAVDDDLNVYTSHYYYKSLDKWSPHDGNKTDLVGNPVSYPTDFAVDETNNIIYLLDTPYKRIFKYTNRSEIGITIVDGSPVQMFASRMGVDIDPLAIAVDKTGYIILGEKDRITIWSSDGKFKDNRRIAHCRNYLLQHVRANFGWFDYYLVVNVVRASLPTFTVNNFLSNFIYPLLSWAIMTASQTDVYYDLWRLRASPTMSFYFIVYSRQASFIDLSEECLYNGWMDHGFWFYRQQCVKRKAGDGKVFINTMFETTPVQETRRKKPPRLNRKNL
ncbi:unnamed protein product [Adineta steineri]|uniref:Uncharacterized protein n=1 Tax=Adineta steineri TaxID=433720 RepID=A0A819EJP0_9BILA|nr:unnamed protein product [Adineta steineri]